jgi:hypothetical protein
MVRALSQSKDERSTLSYSNIQGNVGRSVLTQKFCRTSTKKMLYFHKNLKMTKINESRDQKFFIKKIRNNESVLAQKKAVLAQKFCRTCTKN